MCSQFDILGLYPLHEKMIINIPVTARSVMEPKYLANKESLLLP